MLNRLRKAFFHPSSRGKVRWRLVFVVILGIAAGVVSYPQGWNRGVAELDGWFENVPGLRQVDRLEVGERPYRLGLDLAGGAHLVYEANLSQIPSAEQDDSMAGVRDVIERRVNAFGVAEPLVQTARAGDSWRLVVELAGVRDVKEAIRQIGETPVLEFKEEATPEAERELTDEERRDMEAHNRAARARGSEVIERLKNDEAINFTELVKEYSDDEATKELGGALGFITRDSVYWELWQWADREGPGKISLDPVETTEGLNIVNVTEREERGREVHAQHILICYRGVELCDRDTSKDEARAKVEELAQIATADNFEPLAREHSTEPGAEERSGDLGFFPQGAMVKPFEDAVFAMRDGEIKGPIETQFGFHLIRKIEERPVVAYHVNRILLRTKTEADYIPPPVPWKNTGLSGKHLKRAAIQFDPQINAPEVGLEFNSEGAKLFAEITGRNVGKLVAIFLDGDPISVPRVQTAISDGRAVITGNFTIKEARILAQRLNAGALPVPIELIGQQTVGATLGEASVRASLTAALIGFLMVVAFMIVYYRLAGLLAVIALIIYAAIVLTVFKLVPVTLTLAGIAGFILSIGMAVDANILIFERLKEELRAKKPLVSAIEDAFARAWPSIRDANMTTLFGALILFWFSTSVVKGFGLTLSIGIAVSLFSALTVTRALLRFVAPYVQKAGWYGTHMGSKASEASKISKSSA